MKLIRYEYKNNSYNGLLKGEKIEQIVGDPLGSFELGESIALSLVKLLPPSLPSKIIGVGLNYKDHVQEMKFQTPEEPLIFLKPSTALNGPHYPIVLPPMSHRVDFEGELAVVIRRKAHQVSEKEASQYILGYSCFNDVTARDLQKKDGQFTRAKSFDTFACLGPCIETELDPSKLKIETRVNGELKQSSHTSQLLFSVFKLVSFISHVMTLLPGDVISTGTPSGVGPLKKGDSVEVRIEGVGTLINPVI